jgi:hypothetical protein
MWILRILRPRPRLTSALQRQPNPQDELFEVIRKAAVWLPFY